MTTTDPELVFDRLGLPDSPVARAAYAFTARATPAFVHNHSIRSYVFARAHAQRSGVDYDDELVFLSCVLHDIGLSDEGNGHQRFEVDGADVAAAFLREQGIDDRRVEIAWDAIALHTSQGIAERKGTEVAVTQAGIATDILGVGRDELPPGLADKTHALLPREDLAYALTDAILVQAKADPRKAAPLTFPGELLRLHLPHGAVPEWPELIAAAGWGDRPTGATSASSGTSP